MSSDHFADVSHKVCRIYTGRINTNDPDALDITVKSANTREGCALMPSWEIVNAVKSGEITPDEYTAKYLEILRYRYRQQPDAFHAIFERERVVLTCYCQEGSFCHRHIAVDVLSKIAKSRGVLVELCGELQPVVMTMEMFG